MKKFYLTWQYHEKTDILFFLAFRRTEQNIDCLRSKQEPCAGRHEGNASRRSPFPSG